MKSIKNLKNYFLLAAVLFLAACSMWNDFTTYFNLYYNTKQLYEEAQLEIKEVTKDPFGLDEPNTAGNLKTILTDLQEKSSKILQHESESAYFDDALFMSGFAFYYSGNFIKANRKFQELASLQVEEYELKSRLWIAKCDLQMRRFEEGMKLLSTVKDSAIANEDDEILEETYRVLIAYYKDRQDIPAAITEGYNFIEVSGNDELKAEVAYQIGLLQLEQGNDEEAAAAFESVLDFSPTFEIEFESKFELAKLKKELGQQEESIEMFDDLYNEGKYSQYWGDVYYQLGLIEYENENYEKAFEIFTDVNELYSGSFGAIQSNLMLGEIMRVAYADYDSAKTYYDKVKTSNDNPEIKELADVYSQSITSYLSLKKQIETADNQIGYIQNPEQFVRDSVAYVRYVAAQKEETENLDPQQKPGLTSTQDTTTISDTTGISDSTITATQDSLFASTSNRFDYDIEFDEDYVVTEKPVYPVVGIDSLESTIAKTYFDLGNLFFSDLNRLDSAYFYYSTLLDNYPNTKNKPRVLVALGTYWETNNNQQKSDSLYQIVYDDYKTHPIANEAAQRLGKPPLITEEDPAKDEYLDAESEIEDSSFTEAITKLKSISKEYPESIYQPKSLYTIGWLYENKLSQPDSAIHYYSSLLAMHRNSEYANAVRQKVTIYDDEMRKLQEQAEADTVQTEPTLDGELPADSTSVIEQPVFQDSLLTNDQPVLHDSLSTFEAPDKSESDSLSNSQMPDTTSIDNN